MKVRNEEHIIEDTLNIWGGICDGGIHVYDDCSQDGTVEICKNHSAVAEVVTSDLFDPDRERAEWWNRKVVLHSARRFITHTDWICYFDADEQIEEFDSTLLDNSECELISLMCFDPHITEEDKDLPQERYRERKYVGQEFYPLPFFFRNTLDLDYFYQDQRLPYVNFESTKQYMGGKLLHWGKGISEEIWERKCDYYADVFGPKYSEKWANRRGKAIHTESDFGNPLVLWDDILSGKVEPMDRLTGMELVQ